MQDPPAGHPWDAPVDEAPLAFVDLEMTGLAQERDRVLEICVERVVGGQTEARLSTLIRPDDGTFGNEHVHGIRPEDVAAAPTFAEVIAELEPLLHGAVLVAHAAAWDVAFLEAELSRAGRPTRWPHYLDTLALSRRALSSPSHRLTSLRERLGLSAERAHRAADDVLALRALWGHLLSILSPRTLRDLWHVRVGERRARPAILEAAVALAASGAPARVRYRPSGRGVQELTFVVTAVLADLDPPRVLGYLVPARSRRELRADRIVALEPLEAAGS